ncbi:MAG: trehalose-phosphatase [Candidatus Omnitrophota bacterium]
MRYLFDDWGRVERQLARSHVYLLMDFDGTISSIRRDPGAAGLNRNARRALDAILHGPGNISLAVVSGRGLRDIRRRVGIKGITYAGNHGLEIKGPGMGFIFPGALAAGGAIRKISRKLKAGYRKFNGVIVEDKGFTVSVHFRMAKPSEIKDITNVFEEVTGPYRAERSIAVTSGKKVLEVRPPVDWDKGKAVGYMVASKKKELKGKVLAVYIGDDRTDEDAFRAIGKNGVCIFVGKPERTSAGYYLNNTGEVVEFLKRVLKIKGGNEK